MEEFRNNVHFELFHSILLYDNRSGREGDDIRINNETTMKAKKVKCFNRTKETMIKSISVFKKILVASTKIMCLVHVRDE